MGVVIVRDGETTLNQSVLPHLRFKPGQGLLDWCFDSLRGNLRPEPLAARVIPCVVPILPTADDRPAGHAKLQTLVAVSSYRNAQP